MSRDENLNKTLSRLPKGLPPHSPPGGTVTELPKHTATPMTPEQSKDRVGYFTLADINSHDDYFFDIDNLSATTCPPDVQAYLESVSLSIWGLKQPVGCRTHDKSGTPYVPDMPAIERGIGILRRAKSAGIGKFYEPGHKFSEESLRNNKHYPWYAEMTAEERETWLDQMEEPLDQMGLEFILLGNVRIPLPNGLTPPERNAEWVSLIGQLYSDYHPVAIWRIYDWYSPDNLNDWLGYKLADYGGERGPVPKLPDDPVRE